jgi:hypothetical protein
MKKLALITISALLFGCSQDTPRSGEAPKAPGKAESPSQRPVGNASDEGGAEKEKSGIGQEVGKVVEDVTGITSLRSGRKAQDRVRDIQQDYNRKMEQVLEETE